MARLPEIRQFDINGSKIPVSTVDEAARGAAEIALEKINTEIIDRSEADSKLQEQIDEIATSGYDDTEVRGLIQANSNAIKVEESARKGADASLNDELSAAQARINSVSTTANSALETANNLLTGSALAAHAQLADVATSATDTVARASADRAIEGLASEALARSGAVDDLQNQIDSIDSYDDTAVRNLISANATAIATETSDRQTDVASLGQRINNLNTQVATNTGGIQSNSVAVQGILDGTLTVASATIANSAASAETATYATTAGSATSAGNADTATYATSAGTVNSPVSEATKANNIKMSAPSATGTYDAILVNPSSISGGSAPLIYTASATYDADSDTFTIGKLVVDQSLTATASNSLTTAKVSTTPMLSSGNYYLVGTPANTTSAQTVYVAGTPYISGSDNKIYGDLSGNADTATYATSAKYADCNVATSGSFYLTGMPTLAAGGGTLQGASALTYTVGTNTIAANISGNAATATTATNATSAASAVTATTATNATKVTTGGTSSTFYITGFTSTGTNAKTPYYDYQSAFRYAPTTKTLYGINTIVTSDNASSGLMHMDEISATVSVPSSTATAALSYNMPSATGYYIIIGAVRFNSNATGWRHIYFANSSGSTLGVSFEARAAAVSGSYTHMQIFGLLEGSTSTTTSPTLYVEQNSGSTLTALCRVRFLRIGVTF